MKIERIRIDAFGRLGGFDTGGTALGNLVVVLGPNEAGKSTLFNFLTTALYGFHPANREKNPHVPWGAEEAAGRIEVTIGEGTCAQIERRLRGSPFGRLTEAGVSRELRNHPVPWAEHVPRQVFQHVFAITLADLAALEPETWARVQERLLGSMGSTDLASPRSVVEGLEKEASELWRPNRRGNQRLRDLQTEIRASRARRGGALERDREVRRIVEERENVLVRLREIRAERQEHRVAVQRAQTLLPVRRQLERIASLRAQGGARQPLDRLPADPPRHLAELTRQRDDAGERIDELTEALAEPDRLVAEFDDASRTVLEHQPQVRRFLSEAVAGATDRHRVRELSVEVDEIRHQRTAAATQLLDAEWSDELAERLTSLSVELVADRVARIASRTTDGAAERPEPAENRIRLLIGGAAAAATGVALLAWSALGGPALADVAGAVLGTAGAITTGLVLRTRVGDGPPSGDGEADRAREDLRRMLEPIPLRPEYLEHPGEALTAGLGRLRDLVVREHDQVRALDATRERVASVDRIARDTATTLGRPGDTPTEALASGLERDLREADRRAEVARGAERERERLGREIEAERATRDETVGRLQELERKLTDTGSDGPRAAAAAAKLRLDAHLRADQLRDELERSHPDLPELEKQIASATDDGGWSLNDAELARLRAHIEELDGQVESLIAEAEALERNAAHLRELETVDAVDSEIETLKETESRLMRERDRKWVVAQLVREADRRFREEHQPDLVRRASEHLSHLTGGRYDRLLIDETRTDGLFHLMGPRLPAPFPLGPPISTGTLEQAYLSLRLAIVDHLDEGRERLPLFIDEAFVNWDRDRRGRGLDVIADLSATRQLFVFTCHPAVAAHLQQRGSRTITLERRP